ncbi:MAG: HAD family hydrolase [Spirochaetales bacterium]|nr:HAD family hydrolase [Spirochaetales bacterium]
MAVDLQQELVAFKPQKEFFIGIDSDGCAFDTMEIKHKECFGPLAVDFFGLQKIAEYAKETWNFVNLYSKTRGCNRFLGLIYTIELLKKRREVSDRRVDMPDLEPLIEWTKKETKLGNAALKNYAQKVTDPIITTALNWSLAVNRCISETVHNIPPFDFVEESLRKLSKKADAVVVSSAPMEALQREWRGNGIDKYMRFLAGQEYGTKTEHVRLAACGKYAPQKMLIIGDAPGDLKAAQNCEALFYPILPGQEQASWENFYKAAADKFFNGTYAGEYENKLLQKFDACLPAALPWN